MATLEGDLSRPLARRRSAFAYREADARVDLNEHGLALAGVPPEVWRYRVGGHPVLSRWLRARRGRRLGPGEARELRWAAEAVARTLAVERRLAEIYPKVEDDRAPAEETT